MAWKLGSTLRALDRDLETVAAAETELGAFRIGLLARGACDFRRFFWLLDVFNFFLRRRLLTGRKGLHAGHDLAGTGEIFRSHTLVVGIGEFSRLVLEVEVLDGGQDCKRLTRFCSASARHLLWGIRSIDT